MLALLAAPAPKGVPEYPKGAFTHYVKAEPGSVTQFAFYELHAGTQSGVAIGQYRRDGRKRAGLVLFRACKEHGSCYGPFQIFGPAQRIRILGVVDLKGKPTDLGVGRRDWPLKDIDRPGKKPRWPALVVQTTWESDSDNMFGELRFLSLADDKIPQVFYERIKDWSNGGMRTLSAKLVPGAKGAPLEVELVQKHQHRLCPNSRCKPPPPTQKTLRNRYDPERGSYMRRDSH